MVEKLVSKEGVRVTVTEAVCNSCGICVEFCARGVLALNEETGRPEVVRIDRCTECRMCELWCPELAIVVTREEFDST